MSHTKVMPAILSHYDPATEPYLPILFSDDQFIAVNKPAGLLSVPGKPFDHKDSVESRAKHLYGPATAVHRLDLETTGVMILALNKKALTNLQQQFEKRTIQKIYRARLFGVVEAQKGDIDLPIRTDWPNRPRQIVDPIEGKQARTGYRIIEVNGNITTVEFTPHTGRTHQLRVHAAEIGHPILGDPFYGCHESRALADTLQLHALSLVFSHPKNHDTIRIEAPCPF